MGTDSEMTYSVLMAVYGKKYLAAVALECQKLLKRLRRLLR